MDLNSIEAIMRLHKQVAGRLPDSVTGVVSNREEPRIGAEEAKLMRALFEERLQIAGEARKRAMASSDEELGALKAAIANIEKLVIEPASPEVKPKTKPPTGRTRGDG